MYRSELLQLPTNNGEHCTGGTIKMCEYEPDVPVKRVAQVSKKSSVSVIFASGGFGADFI